MDARAAFDEFCEEQPFLNFNKFTYALIAVFGFKFKKSDRLLLFRKHGTMHPINKNATKPLETHAHEDGRRFVDTAYGEFPPGYGVNKQQLKEIVETRKQLLQVDQTYVMFQAMDEKRQGYISIDGFREIFRTVLPSFATSANSQAVGPEELFCAMDTGGRGRVFYEDFRKFLQENDQLPGGAGAAASAA